MTIVSMHNIITSILAKTLSTCLIQDAPIQPSLVIVYFGGNDSSAPLSSGLGPHVPLQEYIENLRKIVDHLKVFYFPHQTCSSSANKPFYLCSLLEKWYIFSPSYSCGCKSLTQIIMIARASQRTLAFYFSVLLPSMMQQLRQTGSDYNRFSI